MTTTKQVLSDTAELVLLHFNKAFDIAEDIQFNPNWANGTGYYNHAVAGQLAPKLHAGEVCRCISSAPNNRKILLIGTPVGNVVVFQRYTDDESVFVCNMPMVIEQLTGICGAIDPQQMYQLVGKNNIGQRLLGFLLRAAEFHEDNKHELFGANNILNSGEPLCKFGLKSLTTMESGKSDLT